VAAARGTAHFSEAALLNPTVTFFTTSNGALAPTATGGADDDPTPDDPSDFELPQIPGYRVLRVLGRGGMGVVYKARNLALDRIEALKLIVPGWLHENDFRVRFAREVLALGRLDHPNVVPIYGAGSWQGLPFLTMKFVAGKTLYHHMERLRRDKRALVGVIARVARAVEYLHANGIVHRDLKPLNILLTESDEPFVADFGLVRLSDQNSELSVPHVPLGTRHYMSPEQTLGGRANYTPACDIWALGVVLYEVLSGHRPFAHEDTAELFRQIRHDPPQPIPADRDVSGSLDAIARKCMAKAVADRYATAGAVATDLEDWLAGKQVRVPPPPVPRRRFRWAIAAAALVATLGFSGAPQLPPRPVEAPPHRTLAERVRDGDTVWVIGPRGLPLVPTRPLLPGAVLAVDRDGFCLLNALTYQCVEFGGEPIPVPFRFEAEVAIRAGKPGVGHGGFYVGEQAIADGNDRVHALWKFGVVPLDGALEGEELVATDQGLSELVLLRALSRDHISLPLGRVTFTRRAPAKPDRQVPAPWWHAIAIDVREGQLAGACDGKAFAPAELGKKLTSLGRRFGLPPGTVAPPLGPGIGLFAIDAEVVFRNVRLSPLKP
jgi:predicted Ser/Thr protein kinase